MKATLVLAANVVLSLVGLRVGLADECHNICADVQNGVHVKSGCSAFRNALPRPKVSSICQSGFKAAVDLNCYDACANGGYLRPFISESRLKEVCNSALKETPRQLCHDACVRGYRSGLKDMTTSLVKRMAEGAPKVLTALKKDTSARQKDSQRARVTTVAPETSALAEETKPIASANSEVTPSSRVEPDFAGAELLDAEVKKPVESVDAITGKTEEVHVDDEEPPFSAVEIDMVESEGKKEVESEDNVDGEVGEQHEAGNEEDIYKWIKEEAKVLLSLPITVDNVEKELTVFEGDEPMDVVLEFCRDNMPGEAGCADELFGVVADKISPPHAPYE